MTTYLQTPDNEGYFAFEGELEYSVVEGVQWLVMLRHTTADPQFNAYRFGRYSAFKASQMVGRWTRIYAPWELPQPDWAQAPQWAQWWAVDPNGFACWYEEEPILSLTVGYSGWVAATLRGVQLGNAIWAGEIDIPLGVDWRVLKQQRAAQATEPVAQQQANRKQSC